MIAACGYIPGEYKSHCRELLDPWTRRSRDKPEYPEDSHMPLPDGTASTEELTSRINSIRDSL